MGLPRLEALSFPPVNIASRSSNRPRNVVIGIAVVVVVGLLFYWAALGEYKGVIGTVATTILRREFASDVRFQKMEISVFPRVHVVANGVSIGGPAHPLIEATQADARCGWIPWHVRTVLLEGLVVRVPAAAQPIHATGTIRPVLNIDQMLASSASVELAALRFQLRDLRVRNFSTG